MNQKSVGKLRLFFYRAVGVKNDHAENLTIHAVIYQAVVRAKEDLLWGSLADNKQSRYVPFPESSSTIMRNVTQTKKGETKEIQYTIVLQKKDGRWMDQFGKAY